MARHEWKSRRACPVQRGRQKAKPDWWRESRGLESGASFAIRRAVRRLVRRECVLALRGIGCVLHRAGLPGQKAVGHKRRTRGAGSESQAERDVSYMHSFENGWKRSSG